MELIHFVYSYYVKGAILCNLHIAASVDHLKQKNETHMED